MDLKELFTDDDAVSPVIGVILMVAITVILAAVIGAFVLDIGQNQEVTPQATYDWTQSGEYSDSGGTSVTLEHTGGDSLNPDQISINVDADGAGSFPAVDGSNWASSDEIVAGDTISSDANFDDAATVSVIWRSSDGGSSSQLTTHDVE